MPAIRCWTHSAPRATMASTLEVSISSALLYSFMASTWRPCLKWSTPARTLQMQKKKAWEKFRLCKLKLIHSHWNANLSGVCCYHFKAQDADCFFRMTAAKSSFWNTLLQGAQSETLIGKHVSFKSLWRKIQGRKQRQFGLIHKTLVEGLVFLFSLHLAHKVKTESEEMKIFSFNEGAFTDFSIHNQLLVTTATGRDYQPPGQVDSAGSHLCRPLIMDGG